MVNVFHDRTLHCVVKQIDVVPSFHILVLFLQPKVWQPLISRVPASTNRYPSRSSKTFLDIFLEEVFFVKIIIQAIDQDVIVIGGITREFNTFILIVPKNFLEEFWVLHIEKDFSLSRRDKSRNVFLESSCESHFLCLFTY